MDHQLFEEETFDKHDFTITPLAKGEYEYCTFIGCNFANTNLTDIKFLECAFTGCNLSLVTIANTAFRDIKFKDCKMLGLHFEHCNPFGLNIHLDNCILDHASFYQVKLKKTFFKDCRLVEVDFTECDLSSAVFSNCTLTGATFDNTILEKADLRTAYNYSIDPGNNKIKKARFSYSGIAGLLDKYDIDIDRNS